MRFAVLFLGAIASLASASTLIARQGSFPPCSLPCLGAGDLGNCAATDNVCLCNNKAYIANTTACITSKCSASDLQQAEATSVALCKAAGVNLSTVVSGATTTAAGSGATVESAASTTVSAAAAATSKSAATNLNTKGSLLGGLAAIAGVALFAL